MSEVAPPPSIDYAELAKHLAGFLCPDALLDAASVAALLKCEPRTVSEHYAKAPGFPKAIRPEGPNGKAGHPRWIRQEIADWVASHRKAKAGRPRKVPMA